MTTLNVLSPYWESFIQTIIGRTKLPKFYKYRHTIFKKRQRLQQGKDSMVLKLRRIEPSSPMPITEREKERIFLNISTRLGGQVLLEIWGKIRRIYHTYNATSVRNMVITQGNALVQTRGSMKLQPLMWKMFIITRNKEMKIVQNSSSYKLYQVRFPPSVIYGS